MKALTVQIRALCILFAGMSLLALGCTPLTPMGAAHLVRNPAADAPKGSVTSSVSLDYFEESGEFLAFQGSGAARFSLAENYDLSAAVAKAGLLNGEGALDLTSGDFRLSFIHGLGFATRLGDGDDDRQDIYGAFAGFFWQWNLDEKAALFFATRYGLLAADNDTATTIGSSLGYAWWTSGGLQIAPELSFIQVQPDEGDSNILISPMLNFSAPF